MTEVNTNLKLMETYRKVILYYKDRFDTNDLVFTYELWSYA